MADDIGANAQRIAVVPLDGAAIRADARGPRAAAENGHARGAGRDDAWERLDAGKNLFVHANPASAPREPPSK